jgi:hypothetical protein
MSKDRKDTVMSFRMPGSAKAWLDKDLSTRPIVNVLSANRFCRKIVLDYISGRLAYLHTGDRTVDSDMASNVAPFVT